MHLFWETGECSHEIVILEGKIGKGSEGAGKSDFGEDQYQHSEQKTGLPGDTNCGYLERERLDSINESGML